MSRTDVLITEKFDSHCYGQLVLVNTLTAQKNYHKKRSHTTDNETRKSHNSRGLQLHRYHDRYTVITANNATHTTKLYNTLSATETIETLQLPQKTSKKPRTCWFRQSKRNVCHAGVSMTLYLASIAMYYVNS